MASFLIRQWFYFATRVMSSCCIDVREREPVARLISDDKPTGIVFICTIQRFQVFLPSAIHRRRWEPPVMDVFNLHNVEYSLRDEPDAVISAFTLFFFPALQLVVMWQWQVVISIVQLS